MFDVTRPTDTPAIAYPQVMPGLVNLLAKAQVNVKAHQSRAKDGHVIQVQQHTMAVDKKALVSALAGMYKDGHATTFTSRRQAAAYAAKNPGIAVFEHDGELHAVNKHGAAGLAKLGVGKADLTGKVKTGEIDTSSPDHLLASGHATLSTLRNLTPGTPEHKHVLEQYESIQRMLTAWNASDGKTATPKDPKNGPRTRREEFARAKGNEHADLSDKPVPGTAGKRQHDPAKAGMKPPDAPDFVKGGADKLKTPRQFELASRTAATREDIMALAHYFNHHTATNGHTGPRWDAAWGEINAAIGTLPPAAHIEKKKKLDAIHAQSAQALAMADEHVKRTEAAAAAVQGQHARAKRKEADARPRATATTPGEKVAIANRKRAATKAERAARELADAKKARDEMAAVHAQVTSAAEAHATGQATPAAAAPKASASSKPKAPRAKPWKSLAPSVPSPIERDPPVPLPPLPKPLPREKKPKATKPEKATSAPGDKKAPAKPTPKPDGDRPSDPAAQAAWDAMGGDTKAWDEQLKPKPAHGDDPAPDKGDAPAPPPPDAPLEDHFRHEQATSGAGDTPAQDTPAADGKAGKGGKRKKAGKPAGDRPPSEEVADIPKPSDAAKGGKRKKDDAPGEHKPVARKPMGHIGHKVLRAARAIKDVLSQIMAEKDRENTRQE